MIFSVLYNANSVPDCQILQFDEEFCHFVTFVCRQQRQQKGLTPFLSVSPNFGYVPQCLTYSNFFEGVIVAILYLTTFLPFLIKMPF